MDHVDNTGEAGVQGEGTVSNKLTRDQIETYLQEVGAHLDARGLIGEILITGGAFMTLVLKSRPSTKDVDAFIASDATVMRAAVAAVAKRHHLPETWLNEAVKGFLHTQPTTRMWAQYPGLRIYVPTTDYIFAMKADAARPEDRDDLLVLKRTLGLKTLEEALAIVEQYIPQPRIRVQTQYMLESLFE
jgi:predicted nucleotidyltransferase